MTLKSLNKLIILKIVFISLFLTGCEKPNPAIWLVEDDDTKLYISGSVHSISKDTDWSTKKFDEILSKSNEFIMESYSPYDQQYMEDFIINHGNYKNGETLRDHISSEVYKEFDEKLFEITGLKRKAIIMTPWRAGLYYSFKVLKKEDSSPKYSLDTYLEEEAKRLNLKFSGLENAQIVIDNFLNLSNNFPDQMILSSLQGTPDMGKAWANGNVSYFDSMMNDFTTKFPDFQRVMLVDRNKNWLNKIKEKMNEPGTKLINVGIGHLAGDQSLIDLLNEAGLSVSRIQ